MLVTHINIQYEAYHWCGCTCFSHSRF